MASFDPAENEEHSSTLWESIYGESMSPLTSSLGLEGIHSQTQQDLMKFTNLISKDVSYNDFDRALKIGWISCL